MTDLTSQFRNAYNRGNLDNYGAQYVGKKLLFKFGGSSYEKVKWIHTPTSIESYPHRPGHLRLSGHIGVDLEDSTLEIYDT